MNRNQSFATVRKLTAALIGPIALALITGCAGKKPECDGNDAETALQSLFRDQTVRIIQRYAFDQSDPLQMIRLGAALDLGLADDGVTLMLRPADAAKIVWQFEAREISTSFRGTTTCIGRATFNRGQFSDHFPFRFELSYTSGGEIDIALLN